MYVHVDEAMWVYNNSGPCNWLISKVCIKVNYIRHRLAITANFQEPLAQSSSMFHHHMKNIQNSKLQNLLAFYFFPLNYKKNNLHCVPTCLTKQSRLSLTTTRFYRTERTTETRSQKTFHVAPCCLYAPALPTPVSSWLVGTPARSLRAPGVQSHGLFSSSGGTWHSSLSGQLRWGGF